MALNSFLRTVLITTHHFTQMHNTCTTLQLRDLLLNPRQPLKYTKLLIPQSHICFMFEKSCECRDLVWPLVRKGALRKAQRPNTE